MALLASPRRLGAALAACVALAALAPAGEAATARGDDAFGARLAACHRSPRIDARSATVSAWMRPIDGAPNLALKVDLLQRPLAGGRWTLRDDVPGLGRWTTPDDPSLGTRDGDLFRYRQAVGRLEVPFAYRFRVRFRWQDDGGNVVRTAAATTRACREPDLRPDLLVERVRTRSVGAGVRYAVRVRNDGRSTARHVAVAATLPGDTTPDSRVRTVGRLDPGERAEVVFVGPGCPAGGTPPSFAVDPRDAIDESDEANDRLVLACPVP